MAKGCLNVTDGLTVLLDAMLWYSCHGGLEVHAGAPPCSTCFVSHLRWWASWLISLWRGFMSSFDFLLNQALRCKLSVHLVGTLLDQLLFECRFVGSGDVVVKLIVSTGAESLHLCEQVFCIAVNTEAPSVWVDTSLKLAAAWHILSVRLAVKDSGTIVWSWSLHMNRSGFLRRFALDFTAYPDHSRLLWVLANGQ